MKISNIISVLGELAPFSLQEEYDNSGLLIGDPGSEAGKGLVCLDVTAEILEEAIAKDCQVVISHHPLIFGNLKRLTGQDLPQRIIVEAIRKDISILAMHTNLDNIEAGVNQALCEKLGLHKLHVLDPMKGRLRKLVTFCPTDQAERVREAIFNAGAGYIGNYDCCSFNIEGKGTFRAGEGSDPFVGQVGKLHVESEVRIETILPDFLASKVIAAMKSAHPYEEVAYDLYPLENPYEKAGAGMAGELSDPLNEKDFLDLVKDRIGVPYLRHSRFLQRKIDKIAVCGGSGSFLMKKAITSGQHAFITADLKYHQFFEADGQILLVDAGHFETEQFALGVIADHLKKKIPNFAVLISELSTNPIRYY